MGNAEKTSGVWRHNEVAEKNGWGRVALPLVPRAKKPIWGNWTNPNLVYDKETYSPESYDLQGCGVGLRAGLDLGDRSMLLAVDIDVKDWKKVGEIMALVRKHFGVVITREGLPPKILVPLRVMMGEEAETWKPLPIQVGDGYKVEIIYRGKQFVWEGIHPDTGKPYTHSVDMLGRDFRTLGVVGISAIKKFWDELKRVFQVAGPVSGAVKEAGARVDVGAGLEALRKGEDIHDNLMRIVASLVNAGMDRDMVKEWIVAGKVIEGLPRDSDRLGDMDDERTEIGRIIEGAVSKYAVGSRWEFMREGLLGKVAGTEVAKGEFGVGPVGVSEDNPFAVVTEADQVLEAHVAAVKRVYGAVKALGPLVTVSTGFSTAKSQLSPAPWIDTGYLFLKGATIALQGKAAASKSTFILAYMLHLMTGVSGKAFGAEMRMNLKGEICVTDEDRVRAGQELRVLYLSADDASSEVRKRVVAWGDHWGVSAGVMAALDGRFHILSVTEGVMDLELDGSAGLDRLREVIEREKINLVVGDPAPNLLPTADGDNADALRAMKRVIALLESMGVAGCLVFHVRKAANGEGADSTLDDIRGASAVGGAVRGSFDIRRLSKTECEALKVDPKREGRRIRLVSHVKNNYGPLADDRYLEIVSVDMQNAGLAQGDTLPVMIPWVPKPGAGVPDSDIDVFLGKLGEAEADENHYSPAPQSKDRSVFKMGREDFGWTNKQVENVLKVLTDNGYIEVEDVKIGSYAGRSKKTVRGIVVKKGTWEGLQTDAECDPFGENPA